MINLNGIHIRLLFQMNLPIHILLQLANYAQLKWVKGASAISLAHAKANGLTLPHPNLFAHIYFLLPASKDPLANNFTPFCKVGQRTVEKEATFYRRKLFIGLAPCISAAHCLILFPLTQLLRNDLFASLYLSINLRINYMSP